MLLKDNLWTISKLQTTCFYHKNSKSYMLLNMATLKKTLCKINKACYPICMLLNTIYEHSNDKQELKGIFNIVFGVNYIFVV